MNRVLEALIPTIYESTSLPEKMNQSLGHQRKFHGIQDIPIVDVSSENSQPELKSNHEFYRAPIHLEPKIYLFTQLIIYILS